MNNEAIGATITNLHETIQRDSSSKDWFITGLQENAREDLSSNNNTKSCGEDSIYDNGKTWGYNTLILSQIIVGKPGGMSPINVPTLYIFSWHGCAQICKNPPVKATQDFYQAKE